MGCYFFVQNWRRRLLKSSVLFLFLISFAGCFKNEAYEKQVKSLDSLSGALNQKLSEFKQIDTIILAKAVSKFKNYRQFIQQSINDTVSKDQANVLQQFYNSGSNLEKFQTNRQSILARGNLINSQLNKLITDAKENSFDSEKLMQYVSEEKKQADELIKNSVLQQQTFQNNLQEFKLSIRGVEELMKSRNNGQMPTIIKDSIPL